MSSTTENRRRSSQPGKSPGVTQDIHPETEQIPRSTARMSPALQREFLELMVKGASPHGACGKLEVSLASFWNTLEHDAQFAAELQRVWDTLSFNVVSALYRAAMEGNGSAQQFWLKHRPPPRWAVPDQDQVPADELEALTDAELLDRARTEAPDLAAEIATRIAAAGSRFASEVLPPDLDRADD